MKKKIDVYICMPYFERLDRLTETLESFHKAGYFDDSYPLSVGVSVVDDGSTEQPCEDLLRKEKERRVAVKYSKLPEKDKWLNPCVPMNAAVLQTDSPWVLLQSPETMHPMAILHEMFELINDSKDTILCPTRVIGNKDWEWYAHPEHRPNKYWWCQMLSRLMFDEIGGFDERFRYGRDFDDNDFMIRLSQAGVNWIWAKKCEAIHIKKHCKYIRPIEENRRYYNNKHTTVIRSRGK